MKKNGNDLVAGNYYIGIDAGTDSVGWAVTDKSYNILKHKGNAMWGVRLFGGAQDASERRGCRTARRRAARTRRRIVILEMLFGEELAKADPSFLMRLHESGLWENDKSCAGKYSLFNDPVFTDKHYYKQYPTIYHLRHELASSCEPHDIRLVYLALHHIMKHRGHFLYDTGDAGEIKTLDDAFKELNEYLNSSYGVTFDPENREKFISELLRSELNITAKKKALRASYGRLKTDPEDGINLTAVSDMLSGCSIGMSTLFYDDTLKNVKFSLKDDLEEKLSTEETDLGDRAEVLFLLKTIFDLARLSQMLQGGRYQYVCDVKVDLYDKNHRDLRLLKEYVRNTVPDQYRHIFSEKKDKLDNYAAYSGYTVECGEYTCNQEQFCKFLKKTIPSPEESDTEMQRIYSEISDSVFLTKLRGTENGVIPYQLQKRELEDILEHASAYLPFLNSTGNEGITVKDKIIKTFEFRIPYYVGALGGEGGNHWAIRFEGQENTKVYPWNFGQVVDSHASAEAFIENLIGRCTYTGEKVLPKDSLLYSEYALLNEINLLRINGKPVSNEIKLKLIDDLFYNSAKKVTKEKIADYLKQRGLMTAGDELSGIDDNIKTVLRSYHDFKRILNRTKDTAMVESIIRAILVFSGDKKMLRSWLKRNTHDLNDKDISHICRLNYSGWGRLSETFLTGIVHIDDNGKSCTIMDMLRSTDKNLMQLLTDEYQFAKKAEDHRNELLGDDSSLTARLNELYIAPAVRRSIRQTMRIVDEIVDIQKSVPEKIFIEMARGSSEEIKNKRTESRKTKLIELYKKCGEESSELFKRLEREDDNSLRRDKLFLYYTQLGKCAYSGEGIDFGSLAGEELYDIDHIFPRSKIRDNSIDNRVLVKSTLNREKTDSYPISGEIRNRMESFWRMLKDYGLISDKKFNRLTRSYELTDTELSAFVARQLTETQQATKALAAILKEAYGNRTTIVYSKAGNVSDFRQKYGQDTKNSKGDYNFIKCREVNDLHHAKDAYLNIVVGNVYHTRFTERFFDNIRNENYSLNRVFEYNVDGAWDKNRTIVTVRKYMAKNNVLVTRRSYEKKGKLFNVNLEPAGKLPVQKKRGLCTEKYGGYNYINVAFFCVVEHKQGKKRIRSFEPVYIHNRNIYDADPAKYCSEILGLSDPLIIAKVPIDSLLKIEGKYLWLSGKYDESRILFKHSYQLILAPEMSRYVKKIEKYIERCKGKKELLPITVHDGITAHQNVELFNCFIEKCGSGVYSGLFDSLKDKLESAKSVFGGLTTYEQAEVLTQILHAFQCNAQYADLKKLQIMGKQVEIRKNKTISKLSEVYLINQSVTGLFEHKVDLLK